MDTSPITIETTVNAPLGRVWELWNDPAHVVNWNTASQDWHTTKAVSNLEVGQSFSYTMAAKDGSFSFDFEGTYTQIDHEAHIAYTMPDGRRVSVTFTDQGGRTQIVETFEPEGQNPRGMQQQGWQSILDNFGRYAEKNA